MGGMSGEMSGFHLVHYLLARYMGEVQGAMC